MEKQRNSKRWKLQGAAKALKNQTHLEMKKLSELGMENVCSS